MRTRAGDLVVTPGVTGTDGIAFVSRLVVRALEPPSAGTAAPVEVLSVGDSPGSAPVTRALGQVALSGAAGRKLRFIALALRRALAGPRPSNIVCLHLRLSPVARLVTRRAGTARRLPARHRSVEAARPAGAVGARARGRAAWRTPSTPRGAFARRTRDSPGGPSPSVISAWARPTPLGPLRPAHATSRARSPSSSGASPARSDTRVTICSSTSGRGSWTRCPARASSSPETATTARASKQRPPRSAAACGSSGACPMQALDALYRDCAFFVMPSRDEGFGLVFLEAMRAGKACIGGAGAAAEIIEDGVTGLVVDATDADEVAEGGRAALPRARDAGAHGTGGGRAPRRASSPKRTFAAASAPSSGSARRDRGARHLRLPRRRGRRARRRRAARGGRRRGAIRAGQALGGLSARVDPELPRHGGHDARRRGPLRHRPEPALEPVAQGALRPRPSAEPRTSSRIARRAPAACSTRPRPSRTPSASTARASTSACTGSSTIRRISPAPFSSRPSTRRPSAPSTASATSSAPRGPSAAGRSIEGLDRVYFPHSLGLFYLAITQHLGFTSYGDEYKVMGLAPYGAPDFAGALCARPAPPAGGRLRARPLVLSPRVGRHPHDLGRRRAGDRPRLSPEARGSPGPGAAPGGAPHAPARGHRGLASIRLRAGASSTCSGGSTRGRGSRGSAWPAAAP